MDTADAVLSEPEMREHLADRLVRYKIPRTFEWVGEPLRDDAGKVRRSALREGRAARPDQSAHTSISRLLIPAPSSEACF